MIYDVLYEKLNPRSGNVRPYVPHDDKESAILYDIEWKGTVHFIVCGWIHFGWYYVTRNNEEISETYHFDKIDEKSLKSMQTLMEDKVISYNKKDEIRQILQKFSISYDYDEIENSYIIYGYK